MTASTMAGTITFHGRANVAMRWCALCSLVRAVGQPEHQAQREAHDGTHDPDDDAVGLQDEPDVAVGRPHGLEHPEGAHAALRQHGEAADRHQGDEEHAHRRQRQHDGRRVDDVVVVRARRRDVGGSEVLDVAVGDASKRTLTCVGCVTWPGGTSANSSSRLWGFCTMPTTVLPPWGHVSPTRRLSSEAKPGREGDLVRPGRVVPRQQLQHRSAVGAVRDPGTAADRSASSRGR